MNAITRGVMFLGFHTTGAMFSKAHISFYFYTMASAAEKGKRAKRAHFIPITRMVLYSSSGWEQQQLDEMHDQ